MLRRAVARGTHGTNGRTFRLNDARINQQAKRVPHCWLIEGYRKRLFCRELSDQGEIKRVRNMSL